MSEKTRERCMTLRDWLRMMEYSKPSRTYVEIDPRWELFGEVVSVILLVGLVICALGLGGK